MSDRHRKRTVRDALFGLFGAVEETRVHERTPHHDYEARESEAQVAQIIQREVFVLYELEQLSGEEIAERVGVPVGTVWTRLHHARLEFDRIAKKRGLA